VLAENAQPFKGLPLRMDSRFELLVVLAKNSHPLEAQ
jgi:hypothetical protein